MRTISMNFTKILLSLLVGSIFISGCATMEGRWKKAKSLNNIEAYKKFLARYPKGKFSLSARSRIEVLYFNMAKEKNNIEAFEKFIDKFPNGKLSQEAQRRIERFYYENARNSDNIETYEKFLKKYSQGKFVDHVRSRLAEIKKEEEDYWESAKKQNTVESYLAYIDTYHQGCFVDQAIALLRSVVPEAEYEKLVKCIKVKKLVANLKRVPNVCATLDAQEFISEKVLTTTKEVDNTAILIALELSDFGFDAMEAIPTLIERFPIFHGLKEYGKGSFTDTEVTAMNDFTIRLSNRDINFLPKRYKEMWEGGLFKRFIHYSPYVSNFYQRIDVDRFGRPTGHIDSSYNLFMGYIFYAGAYALTKITGMELGIEKKKWEQWWEINKTHYK